MRADKPGPLHPSATLLTPAASASTAGAARCRAASYPVALTESGPADQRIAGHLDAGYVAPRPGVKSTWFYHRPTALASVMLRDEANPEPDVYPADPDFGSIALNRLIAVPVLVVVGQYDTLLCGTTDGTSSAALLVQERAAYADGADLDALVVPDTGHVLNLHRTAAGWYNQTRGWVDQHVGA